MTPTIVVQDNPAAVTEKAPAMPAEKPMAAPAAALVEKPAVAGEQPADISTESAEAVPVVEKSVVASPEQSVTPAIVVQDKPAAVIEKAPAMPAEKPTIVTVENQTSATVENPTIAAIEKPVSATPEVLSAAASGVENPVTPANPVKNEAHPIAVEVQQTEGRRFETVSADNPDEKAVAASVHVIAPATVEPPAPQAVQVAPEVAAVSAASARTEVIVETVNQIVEAVAGQILVTPGIAQGECEVKITLKPTILDGSEITMASKDGTLTVSVTPATQSASAIAEVALPRLETALAEHAPAFRHVSVVLALKKGSRNETV